MRKFRLPMKEYRDAMSIEDLETTSMLYTNWYFDNEEGMTSRQADKAWAEKEELDAYIKSRKGM